MMKKRQAFLGVGNYYCKDFLLGGGRGGGLVREC